MFALPRHIDTEMRKLTNEIVDFRLKDRNIIRLEDYLGTQIKITWKCLKCKYEWRAVPTDIINTGVGCVSCAGLIPLTNETFDFRIKNKKIKRLEDYAGAHTKIKWKCLVNNCKYEWWAKPNDVAKAAVGCPMCGGTGKLNNEIIDKRLIGLNVKRIEDYISIKEKIKFRCLICECSWDCQPYSVCKGLTGCPTCLYVSEKIIFRALEDNDINFIYQQPIKKIDTNEIKKFRLDFYIKNKKIAIEYNGEQHYKPVKFGSYGDDEAERLFKKQLKRDLYIKDFCHYNNINLITINGIEFKGEKLKKYIDIIINERIK